MKCRCEIRLNLFGKQVSGRHGVSLSHLESSAFRDARNDFAYTFRFPQAGSGVPIPQERCCLAHNLEVLSGKVGRVQRHEHGLDIFRTVRFG